MKVGYVAPISIAAVNGGVRNQALQTIQHVREMGIETSLITPWNAIEDNKPDLVHVFGASVENIGIIESLKSLDIPLVLSPVFFSNRSAGFIKIALNIELLTQFLGSGIRSDFSIKSRLCNLADVILPNTKDEARMIEDGFSIYHSKIKVIPNGVEKRFTEADPSLFIEKYKLQNFILFTGQAGAPRKNVKPLLEIAGSLGKPVVIIGSFYEDEYGKACTQIAKQTRNIHLIPTLDHDSQLLASAYAACKVFVLPSQYETPGIAAMEAGLAGARIVITEKGGTKEYFGNHAEYINPDSSESLATGLNAALQKEPSNTLKDHLLKTYTWDKVAALTVDIYKQLYS